MGEFKKWLDKDPRRLVPETRNRYVKYAERILAYFDFEVKSFKSEQLMSNVNTPNLPHIEI